MEKKPKPFKCTIRFVKPESEAERNMRYELWVDSQLRGIRLARKQKEKTAQEIGILLIRIIILDFQRAENSVSKAISEPLPLWDTTPTYCG